MEVVLDLYSCKHDQDEPLICMDEASVQLQGHLYEPIPAEPGDDAKVDYHYTREGVQALFMFFDPHIGWRRVSNRDHHTRVDWAQEIRQLLDVDYPQARKIKLLIPILYKLALNDYLSLAWRSWPSWRFVFQD